MTRVLMLTTSYPQWEGDLGGCFVKDLAFHLAREQDCRVKVIAPDSAVPTVPRVESAEGVVVRRLPYFWPRALQRLAYGAGVPYNLRHSVVAWLNIPVLLLAFVLAVIRCARQSDIIHAHWGPLGALAVMLKCIHRKPVVVTIHGSDLRTAIRPVRRATTFAIRHADAVITLSAEFLEICRGIGGHEKCAFLPNGIKAPDEDVLAAHRSARQGASGPVVITVGRLIPERHHEYLIDAFAKAAAGRPDARLVVVGDGPTLEVLKAKAGRMGLSEAACVFTGRVSPPEVSSLLLKADLYVSPTTVDNFGTAVVEAALHDLPIITTDVGFPGELVIDGRTGRVVPPDDPDALTAALVEMLENPERMQTMGRLMGLRAKSMGLTWRECARRVAGVYRNLVDGLEPFRSC